MQEVKLTGQGGLEGTERVPEIRKQKEMLILQS